MDFGQRLRELRTERGENQSVLADHLGVSGQSYSAYENGREPSYSTLCIIAKYFNVTTDYLLGLSDAREPQNATLVKELGLTEESIKIIRGFSDISAVNADVAYSPDNNVPSFSHLDLMERDPRTYLDLLNLMLKCGEFTNEIMPIIGVLSSPIFNRNSHINVPNTRFKMKVEPLMLYGLHEAADAIIDFVREESRGITNHD